MIRFLFSYILTHIKKSGLFYFSCLVGLFLLYHQTLGLTFTFSSNLFVEGLWFGETGNLKTYLIQIVIHGLIFSFFGLLLLVQITSSFFSDYTMSAILVKKPDRKWVLLHYLSILISIVFLFFLLHLTVLGTYVYFKTGSFLLFDGFLTFALYLIPLSVFIASSVLFFTIMTKNSFSRISLLLGYLIVAAIAIEAMIQTSEGINIIPEFILENNQYIVPFFGEYWSNNLISAYGLGAESDPSWFAVLVPSTVFIASSFYIFNKKVL